MPVLSVALFDMGSIAKIDKEIQNEIARLSKTAIDFASNSRSAATKRAYRSDWKMFCEFCDELGLQPLPASPETVVLWVSNMASSSRKYATILRSLSSISQAHELAELDTPTSGRSVRELLKGIRRTNGVAQRRARALTWPMLEKVVARIPANFIGRRDAALLLVGWAAALRRSEIVALTMDDIDFVEHGFIVHIRKSKTDQSAAGFEIGVPHARSSDSCPVKRLRAWIDLANIKTGPLFFPIGGSGRKWTADIYARRPLSSRMVNEIITRRMNDAGIPSDGFSGHSLRSGFITSAAEAKIPEYKIQIHTRHRSYAVMRKYIREGGIFVENTLSAIY